MNISSDFVSSQEVYQRLHDRVSYLLDWLQVDPDIGKFEQATSVEIEGYRHRLIHEFTRAKDIVDGAAHNANFALKQTQNISRRDNKEACVSNIFKGYVVNNCDSEHRDETTDLGQRLISAAQEVAADTYLRITGFRPSVLGK